MKQKKQKKTKKKKQKKERKKKRKKEKRKKRRGPKQWPQRRKRGQKKNFFYRAGMDAAVMDAVHSWEVATEPMGAVPRPDARGTKRKRAEAPPAGAKRPRW